MNLRRTARRAVALVVHNWPLKVAAIAAATLLYAWLVVAQDSNTYPGPIPVTPVNQSPGTVVTNELRDVEQIRYIAPADLGRLTADDFRATVDLSGVPADGSATSVRVNVEPIDRRVTILDVSPRSIQVVLDESISRTVDVVVDRGVPPSGLDIGDTNVDPSQITVSGPSAAVNRVQSARASVSIDASGIDIDREVAVVPVDGSGEIVTGVDVEPRSVHVTIPIFTNKESRTLPVNPMITGTPAPGFRIAALEVSPLTVSVAGDQDQLRQLVVVDTEPVPVFGATSDVQSQVGLALPTGVVPLGTDTVTVTVRVEPVTETRTYAAGLRLDGRDPTLDYAVVPDRVLLTLYGSVADLDLLGSAPLVVGLNVATLGPGVHNVPVVPSLPSGVTIAALSPETVEVTIRGTGTPPEASPSPVAPGGSSPSVAP